MATRHRACLLAMAILWAIGAAAQNIPDFALQDAAGKWVNTTEYHDRKALVVIFTCLHCPFAKLYPDRLKQLQQRYERQGVQLLLVDASDTVMFPAENPVNMAKLARQQHFTFPFLYDPQQRVARMMKAEKTPHAFVLWRGKDVWDVKYQGAIDDNGFHPAAVQHHFVTDALDELLSGRAVTHAQGDAVGCAIHYR